MPGARTLEYLRGQNPRKLFQILSRMESYGVGRKATRVIWKQEEPTLQLDDTQLSYWTITRVTPKKVTQQTRELVCKRKRVTSVIIT